MGSAEEKDRAGGVRRNGCDAWTSIRSLWSTETISAWNTSRCSTNVVNGKRLCSGWARTTSAPGRAAKGSSPHNMFRRTSRSGHGVTWRREMLLTHLSHFEAARQYPENLGEGKHLLTLERDLDYFSGLAAAAARRFEAAQHYWNAAAAPLPGHGGSLLLSGSRPCGHWATAKQGERS